MYDIEVFRKRGLHVLGALFAIERDVDNHIHARSVVSTF